MQLKAVIWKHTFFSFVINDTEARKIMKCALIQIAKSRDSD